MSHWNTCCLYKSDRDDRQLLQFTPLRLQGVVSRCRGASPQLHQHYTACALDKQEQQITGHVSEFPKVRFIQFDIKKCSILLCMSQI